MRGMKIGAVLCITLFVCIGILFFWGQPQIILRLT